LCHLFGDHPTAWSSIFLEKWTVPHLINFTEPKGLLLCSQKSTASFYLQPINPVQTPPLYFSKVNIDIILSPMPGSSKWTLSFRFPYWNPVCIPYTHHMPQPTHSRFNYRNNIWRHLLHSLHIIGKSNQIKAINNTMYTHKAHHTT